jgi:hypothetical protein
VHLSPIAFFTVILVSSSSLLFLIFLAFDVIKYSAKSRPSKRLNCSLLVLISRSASKLDPISLLDLFSSIAILASCFILKRDFHLWLSFSFSHFFGMLGKVNS